MDVTVSKLDEYSLFNIQINKTNINFFEIKKQMLDIFL